MHTPEPAEEMPSAEAIIAMQDPNDREACEQELLAATGETRRDVYDEWYAYGLLARRADRPEQYALARDGRGEWRNVGHAAA